MLDTYLKWFHSHERILIVVIVLAVGAFGFNKWLDKSATDANRKAAVAEQVLAETVAANKKLAEQVSTQAAQYAQDRAVSEQEIHSLLQTVASRDAASITKIKDVSTPKLPSQVIADLNESYRGELVNPNAVTADGLIQFAAPVVQKFTVTKIEHDAFAADLADDKKIFAKQDDQLNAANRLIETYTQRVDGLNLQIDQTNKKCTADIAVVKADARKGKRFWYVLGVVTGFLGRAAIK